MLTDSTLWQRIEGFDIDDPADEFPFSTRLARANGWSDEKARAAVGEYKRFIYLICVATSPLIPSEVVDQVWRLHLVDTQSYWTALCEGVLGRAVHHGPSKGGRVATYHVLDPYAEARTLYADEFDDAPPAEFWPLVSERFVTARDSRDAEGSDGWIVPQLSGFGSILWCAAAALLAVMTSAADVVAADDAEAVRNGSLAPMLTFAGTFLLAWLAMRGFRRSQTRGADQGLAEIPNNEGGRWG